MKFLTYIQFLAVVMFSQTAMANPDSGLYDPLPPEGSAFVRFINLNEKPTGSRESKIGSKSYMYLEHGEVSPYFVHRQGTVKLNFGDAKAEQLLEEEKLYTVVLQNDDASVLILEDDANTNQAKAQLNVYNISDAPMVSLKAKAGSVDVVKDVATDAAGFRQINPVKIDLSIVSGEEKLFDAGDKTLERGEVYSLFFVKKDEAIWVQSTTNTTK